MPYIHFSEQEKELAKQADIVRFLQVHGEQVKRTGKEFAWDSPAGKVTIRENQWYSQYEQTGGGAVKFLRKFFGMTYPEAVRSLLGESAGQEIRAAGKEKPTPEPKNFSPPPPHSDMRRLYAYLLNERGIDRDIIHAFTHEGLLYEDAVNHNVCFVGKDDNGTVRHLHKRATNPLSDFKGNITGSDAEYAFHYSGRSDRLYVFEAPIDLLAFLTLYPAGWQEHSYVALCSTADRAALRMLKDHLQLKQVYLCLDHDSAGIEGAYRIADSIHSLGEYQVYRLFPISIHVPRTGDDHGGKLLHHYIQDISIHVPRAGDDFFRTLEFKVGLFVKGDIRVSLRDLHSVGAIPNCFAIECTSKSLSKIMCISA